MRRWMKVVFCFLFGIIFTNMFTMDQAVADESFGKREISAESSVLTQKKQAVFIKSFDERDPYSGCGASS